MEESEQSSIWVADPGIIMISLSTARVLVQCDELVIVP